MVKFLNTSATNYYLEELVKNAQERLILISPFLKLNDRTRELLEDKNRLKIDTRFVYGKSELNPKEQSWFGDLSFVRTSFCKNLHAKCYLNEQGCIITSLNLYEFSQVNNNEMGVYIDRHDDTELYDEAYEEARRLIRVSEEVRLSAESVAGEQKKPSKASKTSKAKASKKPSKSSTTPADTQDYRDKLTTSKLARKLGMKTAELGEKLTKAGFLEDRGNRKYITDQGRQVGGEYHTGRFGGYFLWPATLTVE